MQVIFLRRPLVELPKPVTVKITGTGSSSSCYVTLNGTKYTAAASNLSAMTGDTITFGISRGSSSGGYPSSSSSGTIKLNGTTIFTASAGDAPPSSSQTASTLNWVIPKGTQTVTIKLTVGSGWGTSSTSIEITTT